jgi:NADPH-dependent 2,4-dienoyl-CoA reductase/sulfur reductase-like enzyme
VHAESAPRALEGDGRIQRIVTDHGTFACDFAVAAIGGAVNRDLLRGTAIRCEKAILANEFGETNVEGIYAAGDCAAIFDPLFGKHRVFDHHYGAEVTGALAGRNMAGAKTPYAAVNTFDTEVFDLKLKGWGEARQVDRRLIRAATNDASDFIEIGIAADGRIAQILAINHAGEDAILKKLIAQRVKVDGNEETLKDPAFSLETLFA